LAVVDDLRPAEVAVEVAARNCRAQLDDVLTRPASKSGPNWN
jgi:hypothetical protein